MRILVFGDSIVQGFYDPERGGWCNRLEQYVQQRTIESDWNFDTTFFNLGIAGERTSDLVKRFVPEIEARKDSQKLVIMIAIGANDSVKNDQTEENWCSFAEFTGNYQWLIETGKQYGQVVCVGITPIQESLLTPIPWFSHHSYYQSERDRYDQEIRRIAKLNESLCISMADVFGASVSECLVDGVHPNIRGHSLIAERVKTALESNDILEK